MSRLLIAFVFVAHTHVFVHGAQDMHYIHNNTTCIQCQPGTHWVSDCSSAGGSALCKPCPEGTYTSRFNMARYCQKCRTSCININHNNDAAQREVVAQECTSTTDLLCKCKEEYWREPETNGACRTVTKCGQGSGVKIIASENSDTVCEDCVQGATFSNITSTTGKCLSCSTCNTDEVLKRPCTRTEDTVCAIRTTTDGKKLTIGLGIGIPLFVILCIAFGYGLNAFLRSRRDEERHGNGPQARVAVTYRSNTEIEHSHHGNDTQESAVEIELHANGTSAHETVDETGAQVNGTAAHETVDEAGAQVNGTGATYDGSIPELFMQKVYSDLSAEMDSSYRTFFRRNNIHEGIIDVIETEQRRVCERCYKLFLVWGKKQTDVWELPTEEIPLELIRRLMAMFEEYRDLNCTQTCLDILERYQNTWIRQWG